MSLNNTRHSCHDSPPNWYEHIGFSPNTHEIGDFFECGGELNALELAEHGILPRTTHYIFFQSFLSTSVYERRSLSKNEKCEVAGNKFESDIIYKKKNQLPGKHSNRIIVSKRHAFFLTRTKRNRTIGHSKTRFKVIFFLIIGILDAANDRFGWLFRMKAKPFWMENIAPRLRHTSLAKSIDWLCLQRCNE